MTKPRFTRPWFAGFCLQKLVTTLTSIRPSTNLSFLNVATNDEVYNTPFSRYEGKTYINLTAIYFGLNTRRALYEIPAYKASTGGKIFSFKINHLPNIPSRNIKKTIKFKYDSQPYSVEVEVDTMAKALLRNYPGLRDELYFKVAPSDNLKKSLLAQLKPHLEGKSDQEKIEFLVSFTRSGFKYKFDEQIYKRNQPMIAEELFLNEYSDQEDRCALFYFLMTNLTDLDFILVRYNYAYITIAVELSDPIGKPIDYNGKSYFICDPTSPNNSKKIGKWPPGMTYENIEILDDF